MADEKDAQAREALAKIRRFLKARWEEDDPALFTGVIVPPKARSQVAPTRPAGQPAPYHAAPRPPVSADRGSDRWGSSATPADRPAVSYGAPRPASPSGGARPGPAAGPAAGNRVAGPGALAPAAAPGLHESGLINPSASDKGRALLDMYGKTKDCTRCPLGKTRKKYVFGTGNPEAEVVFVGEAPGEQEDLQGFPFVGPAGKLLTTMLEAVGIHRDRVFICNVLKCRPPANRPPELPEIEECEPYLFEQIRTIKPKVIVALGRYAAQSMLQTKKTIGQVKSRWFRIMDADLIATYHPSACLRYPPNKKVVEADLNLLKARLDQLKVRT